MWYLKQENERQGYIYRIFTCCQQSVNTVNTAGSVDVFLPQAAITVVQSVDLCEGATCWIFALPGFACGFAAKLTERARELQNYITELYSLYR